MNKSMAVTALAAIMSVAAIVASIGQQPAMAILQSHNGANASSGHGANANGASGGTTGANGGVGGDAPKAGTGQNGGTNTLGIGNPGGGTG